MVRRVLDREESMEECGDRLIEAARSRYVAGGLSLAEFEERVERVLEGCEGVRPESVEYVSRERLSFVSGPF